MKQYLAIDIGGTAVKLGIVDEEGRVLSKTEQSVCFDNYETPILTTVGHQPLPLRVLSAGRHRLGGCYRGVEVDVQQLLRHLQLSGQEPGPHRQEHQLAG